MKNELNLTLEEVIIITLLDYYGVITFNPID